MNTIVEPNIREEFMACERRIQDAARNMLTASASIGIVLKHIHDEELFLATHSTWKAYIEEEPRKINPEMNQRRCLS
jgi:hypothetical protein